MTTPEQLSGTGIYTTAPVNMWAHRARWMRTFWPVVLATCTASAATTLAIGMAAETTGSRWVGTVLAALLYPLPTTALAVIYTKIRSGGTGSDGRRPWQLLQDGYRTAVHRYRRVLAGTLTSYLAAMAAISPFAAAWVWRHNLHPVLLALAASGALITFAAGISHTFVVPLNAALALPSGRTGGLQATAHVTLTAAPYAAIERLFGRVPILIITPPLAFIPTAVKVAVALLVTLPLTLALLAGVDHLHEHARRRQSRPPDPDSRLSRGTSRKRERP